MIRENDLFYTCSLIEYLARKTNNTKKDIINYLTKDGVAKIYELADIYHCEDINQVSDEWINKCHIKNGNYNLTNKYSNIPSYYDLGKVYKRLILMVNKDDLIETIAQVLSSWIILEIDNYDSSLYYENKDYIYECYQKGKIL